jgi:hypothetical protein
MVTVKTRFLMANGAMAFMSFMITLAVLTLVVVTRVHKPTFILKLYITGMFIVSSIFVLSISGGREEKNGPLQGGDTYTYGKYIGNQKTEGNQIVEPGDILLYRKLRNRKTESIKFIQRLKDGPHVREYYHVAIALDKQSKIEANGKVVTIEPVNDEQCDVFRPPIPPQQRNSGIDYMKRLAGEPYDWWLVTDDILRYVTHDVIHLPVGFVQAEERNKKICTSLVVQYFSAAKWGPKLSPNVSPEDIYLLVKKYEIHAGAPPSSYQERLPSAGP